MRRHRAVGAAVGLLLAMAAPVAARAQSATTASATSNCTAVDSNNGITVTPTSPAADATFADPAVAPDFAGSARDDSRQPVTNNLNGVVDHLTIALQACGTGYDAPAGSGDLVTQPATSVPFDWAPPGGFPYNGRYRAAITASGHSTNPSGTQSATKVVDFAVAMPPAKPSGVKATVGSSGVTISWHANPEPDLSAYEVRRAAQGSKTYTVVTTASRDITSVDDAVGPGDWQYVVRAVRPDADGQPTLHTDSSAASATVTEPPTTATTVAGSAPSGSSTSGTSGSTSDSSAAGGTTAVTGKTSTGSSTAAPTSGGASAGKVDLSKFGSLLAQQRAQAQTEADPGFQEKLPFKPGDQPAVGNDQELGAGDAAPQGLGQRLISDGSDRRRSVGFLAAGLLLFVMSMIGLFVRGEVRRADDLDALDADDPRGDAAAADDLAPPVPARLVEPAPSADVTEEARAPRERRVRRRSGAASGFDLDDQGGYAEAPLDVEAPVVTALPARRPRRPALPPIDAPGLDVPQPAARPRRSTRIPA